MSRLTEVGIAIYIDAVLNHKMGAEETQTFLVSAGPLQCCQAYDLPFTLPWQVQEMDKDDKTQIIGSPREIEGWTKFTFPGRRGRYSNFQWNFTHFTGVDVDDRTGDRGIFRIVDEAKRHCQNVNGPGSKYTYLMGADIDHDHPEVNEDILNWGRWLLRSFPVAGFRLDAVKHISGRWLSCFLTRLRQEAHIIREEKGHARSTSSSADLFAIAEYWTPDVDRCLSYFSHFEGQEFSLFDAPLHYNFVAAAKLGKNCDLRRILDRTILEKRPQNTVTLVENHDTQEGQTLESPVKTEFKPLAYSIVLLRRDGYPCVFLGDLDGVHVQDEKGKPTGKTKGAVKNLSKIMKARKHFAFGDQRDYWDHPSCIGWVRMGSEEHEGCAVVICVSEQASVKRMQVGRAKAGQVFIDILGGVLQQVVIDADGWADFKSPAYGVGIWVRKEAKDLQDFG